MVMPTLHGHQLHLDISPTHGGLSFTSSCLESHVLLLDVSTPQERELYLDVSGQQEPVLLLDFPHYRAVMMG